MNTKVLSAVYKRNFVSYFANPTGYVFICVFVLLSSIAAFIPDEFFNANLANLDQLNRWFPMIMLVFIPAITMSIWAQERQQGTDELLLTLPAGDAEIVLGKYFAAVSIYSVALLFSFICNLTVLKYLGNPDVGLFIGTYIGYWLIGLMMLAIGMIASFLTRNLTIAYILGAMLNAPLVILAWADSTSLAWSDSNSLFYKLGIAMKRFSVDGQFADFGRGVISLSSIVYFAILAGIMIYACQILIGRRHWTAQRAAEGTVHYTARLVSLLLIAGCLVVLVNRFHIQADVTAERLNSLSSETDTLISQMEPESTVLIEAFISPDVPEPYIQTRLDMINILSEIQAQGGSKVDVQIIPVEPYSEQATRAESRYGITPRPVRFLKGDVFTEEKIFMGVAFKCGVQKPVILEFIDRGIPVEYEMIRSLCTVTQTDRKRIGVLKTDADLFGAPPNPMAMQQSRASQIITELQKTYDVFEVDPTAPIEEDMDALLAVQPSSLDDAGMTNFLDVVRRGVPTAVFEDPCPGLSAMPGTGDPKMPSQQAMMMGQQQPEPKGDITQLWKMLGVQFDQDRVIWTDYNPYPKLRAMSMPKEFVFVDTTKPEIPGVRPFNDDCAISSNLQHVALPFPGYLQVASGSKMTYTPLIDTTKLGGTVEIKSLWDQMMMMFGQRRLSQNPKRTPDNQSYTLAALIEGPLPDPVDTPIDITADPTAEKPAEKPPVGDKLKVVVVADADMLSDGFFMIRERGNVDQSVQFDFDNVTFILNALDYLSGDTRFIELRKRRPQHRTLETIDERTKDARQQANQQREQANEDFDDVVEKAQEKLEADVLELRKQIEAEGLSIAEQNNRADIFQMNAQKQLERQREQLERERDEQLDLIEASLQNDIRKVQDTCKLWAVIVPPILPLLLAIGVLLIRRRREREGVSAERLR